MPIPSFDTKGLIPPFIGSDPKTADRSPYVIDMLELVAGLGTTKERRSLLRNLIAYRGMMSSAGYVDGTQFLNGSFCEDVETYKNRPPGDIDVFSVVRMPVMYLTDPPRWSASGLSYWENEIIDWVKNKQRFNLDTYGLILDTSPVDIVLRGIIYWYSLFSHRRDTLDWKGFVAVTLDTSGDSSALAELNRLDGQGGP